MAASSLNCWSVDSETCCGPFWCMHVVSLTYFTDQVRLRALSLVRERSYACQACVYNTCESTACMHMAGICRKHLRCCCSYDVLERCDAQRQGLGIYETVKQGMGTVGIKKDSNIASPYTCQQLLYKMLANGAVFLGRQTTFSLTTCKVCTGTTAGLHSGWADACHALGFAHPHACWRHLWCI